MPTPASQQDRKRRDAMRAAGMRPVRIWVPDTRRAGFADECRRQSRLVAVADAGDEGLDALLDAALTELGDERNA